MASPRSVQKGPDMGEGLCSASHHPSPWTSLFVAQRKDFWGGHGQATQGHRALLCNKKRPGIESCLCHLPFGCLPKGRVSHLENGARYDPTQVAMGMDEFG